MLQVGFGIGDITPKVGMEVPGGFYKNVSTGVLQPLSAVACVLHDGKTPVALIGIDSIAILKETVTAAREAISKATKIPTANILIGANHCHSAGPSVGTEGNADPAYLDILRDGIAKAGIDAWNALHESEIGIGTADEPNLAKNRRFLMRDGRVITHPGKPGTPHNAEIVEPEGPIDPSVGVLAVRGGDGKISGIVVNFGCHSTIVNGSQYHPDYVFFLRKYLQARYGEHVLVAYLLGPCGDVTQVDNQVPGSEFGVEYCETFGQTLAVDVIRAVGALEWTKDAPLAVATVTVPIAVRPEPDVEREKPAYGLGSGWDEQFAKGRVKVAALRAKTPIIPCEVQGIRIGPLGIATNGAEYFSEDGLRIKRCSPFDTTWVVELANEYIGYVPTAQGFVSGGYEARTAMSSYLAIDAGQKLVEGALKALNEVAPKEEEEAST